MKYNYYELFKIEDVLYQLNVLNEEKIREVKRVFEELNDVLGYYFPMNGKMCSYTYNDNSFYNQTAALKITKDEEGALMIILLRLEDNNLYVDGFAFELTKEKGISYSRKEYEEIGSILTEEYENPFPYLIEEADKMYILPDKVRGYFLEYKSNRAIFSFCNTTEGDISFEKDLDYRLSYTPSFQKLFECMEIYKDNCKDRAKIFQKVIDKKEKKNNLREE